MMWTYKQSTGELIDPSGRNYGNGYSGGNCGQNPEGKNNPLMQNVQCIGPIPQGKYRVGEPVEGSHLGPYALPLIPYPDNQMFGRSRFYMHGDSMEDPGAASEGCIIMPRITRETVYNSDIDIEVVS